MDGVKINIKNARQISGYLRGISTEMRKNANQVIKEEFETAVRDAKAIANQAKYTGELEEGIKLIEIGEKFQYKSEAKHAAFAEFGTLVNYKGRAGFEPWAAKHKGLQINQGGVEVKKRIYDWAAAKGIEKQYWWPIYRKIVLAKQGMKGIVRPLHDGYFLAPYIDAKARIIKRFGEIFGRSTR